MTPALSVRVEALGFGAHRAVLTDVRVDVASGERVALLGANGAGKTTLLRAAVGLLPVRGGEVRVRGTSVRRAEDAVAAGAGLVLQSPDDQLLAATVLEDVALGPAHAGAGWDGARDRALRALAAVGAAGLAERPIEQLSFGEKRRVAIAGVLAMEPTVLLLDEPTSGLDPAAELELAALVASVARERCAAVVLATHAVDLVPLLADRVVVLGEGRILADGPAREIFADAPLLARARLRAPWVTELHRAAAACPDGGPLPLTLDEAITWMRARS